MAHLNKQNNEAVSLDKLKEYLNRIRLRYTEKTSGCATMITVRPIDKKEDRNFKSDKSEDSEA